MAHYICKGGCKAVSDVPGVCQAEDCSQKGQPFEECDCADEKHHGAFDSVDSATESTEDKK